MTQTLPILSPGPSTDTQEIVRPQSFSIRLRAQWASLRGCAYGLRQPALVGDVHVAIPDDYDFAALDNVIEPLLEDPLEVPPGLVTASERMVYRLLHWQGAVQRLQKVPVFGAGYMAAAPEPATEHGERFLVAVPCHAAQATIEALNWIRDALITHAADPAAAAGDRSPITERLRQLMEKLQGYAPGGTNNFHLLNAAHILDVPAQQMFPGTYRYGVGANARVLQSTMTDETPSLGVYIAHSKSKTAHLLRHHGVPVPRHGSAASEEQALEIAGKLGYPVVVKPDDQEQGRGVEAGLRSDAAVSAAYLAATKYSRNILIEKHHDGEDYRLTVFRGQVIKILHRRAGGVIGDGVHRIEDLLRIEQQTPRFQRRLRQTGKVLMELDDEAAGILAERGLTAQSVPASGEFIALRRKSNISQGGVQTLILAEDAHPDNLELAIRATRAVHLDLCGVDLIMPDITQSWLKTGAAIIEMNSQPQIGIEKAPEAYQVILRGLLRGNGRIPIQLILCVTDADRLDEAQAVRLVQTSNCSAVSTMSGVWINGRQVAGASANGFDAAQIALADSSVTAAICAMTVAEVLQYGLPADRFDQVLLKGHETASGEGTALLKKALALIRGNITKMNSPVSRH